MPSRNIAKPLHNRKFTFCDMCAWMKIVHSAWMILVLFLPVTAAAEAALPSELAVAIKGADFTTDGIGLFIQGVEDSKPLVAFHAERFFNPASVIKLMTTLIALDRLGPAEQTSSTAGCA